MTEAANALVAARSVAAEGEVITGWADMMLLVYRTSLARAEGRLSKCFLHRPGLLMPPQCDSYPRQQTPQFAGASKNKPQTTPGYE